MVDEFKNAVFDNLQQFQKKNIYFHSSETDKNEFTIDGRKKNKANNDSNKTFG